MGRLRWGIGFVISGIALYAAFAGVDWPTVGSALTQVNYVLLVAAIPVLILLFALRAQRWRLLLYPNTNIRLLSTFGALNVGYLAGNILPLQLGEVARAYVLGETEGLGKVRVLSTIAVERLLDTLVLLTLLGLLIPFVSLPGLALITTAVVMVVALGLGILVIAAVVNRGWAERWLDGIARLVPARLQQSARHWARSLLDGLSGLRNPKILLYVLLLTIANWLVSAAIIYMVLRAFSIDAPVTAAPLLLVATTLGFFIPSSPSAVGVYDAISIRTLTIVFSVAQEPATSYALVAHALYVVPPSLLGAAYFLWNHLSLRRIRAWGDDQNGAGVTPNFTER